MSMTWRSRGYQYDRQYQGEEENAISVSRLGKWKSKSGQGRPSTSGEHESEYEYVQLVDHLGFALALAHDPAHGASVHEGLEHRLYAWVDSR